jgi:hypothetical protein
MSKDDATPRSGSLLGLLVPLILLAYSVWVIYSAAASGVLKWGALGEYSLFSYVLLLGLVSSGVGVVRTRSWRVGGAFLLLFFAYGSALSTIRPVAQIPVSMRWVFDFVAYVTACSVSAAAALFERERRRT